MTSRLLRRVGREVRGDLLDADVLAVVAVEVDRLHRDQVDDAGQVGLEADRDLQHHGVVVELLAQLGDDALGVGAGAVALVDEGDARHLVAGHLAVDGDGLGLHAADRAEHEDRAVEHAQRALDLDREVDVAGGVDDVDVVVAPGAVGRGRLDGDAALALELHRVHLRADAVLALDVVDRVDAVGVEEDALGERRLARVDVGADADVPDLLQLFHGAPVPCRHCGAVPARPSCRGVPPRAMVRGCRSVPDARGHG